MAAAHDDWSQSELLEIGTRQKQAIWMIPVGMLGTVIPFAVIPFAVIPFAWLAIGAISVFIIYKLAAALRSSIACLYIVLAFIPLVNVLALLRLNGKATKALSSAGIKVGLMGAKQADLDRLWRAVKPRDAADSR